MKLRMLETRRGTSDGFTLRQYHEGETYHLPEVLACSFLSAGYAELSGDQSEPEAVEPANLTLSEQMARLRDRLGITQRDGEAK